MIVGLWIVCVSSGRCIVANGGCVCSSAANNAAHRGTSRQLCLLLAGSDAAACSHAYCCHAPAAPASMLLLLLQLQLAGCCPVCCCALRCSIARVGFCCSFLPCTWASLCAAGSLPALLSACAYMPLACTTAKRQTGSLCVWCVPRLVWIAVVPHAGCCTVAQQQQAGCMALSGQRKLAWVLSQCGVSWPCCRARCCMVPVALCPYLACTTGCYRSGTAAVLHVWAHCAD